MRLGAALQRVAAMTDVAVEISHTKWANQHNCALDKSTRDALADYARRRWPHHTAKLAAREWDLTVDEARGLVAGRATFNIYDKVKKAGGWPVILAVEAAVVGHGVDQFLARIGASNESHREQLAALVGDPGPGGPPRRPYPVHLDRREDDRRQSVAR